MHRKMNGLHSLLVCSLMLPCLAAFADTQFSKQIHKPDRPDYKNYKNDFKNEALALARPGYLEVIGAASFSGADLNDGQVNVTSSETDTLQSSDAWKSWGGQLGLGYAYFLSDPAINWDSISWFPMVEPELNVYYSDYKSSGDVYRFGNSAFNELNYDMSIRSTRLMFDTALTVAAWRQYSSYVIAGLGNAWNHISYRDRDKSNVTCSLLNVGTNHDNSHFVWEAGAGATYTFNDTAGLSLEYLYTDFGHLSVSGNGGSVKFNLHAQAVLLGLHVAVA